MAGFNYGGKGDGTGWSSEKGSGPAPGGGGTSSGNGGNTSNGGKGNSSNNPGKPVSKDVGDSIASSLGINPAVIKSYFTDEDGNVIGISPLVGGDAFGINLGPAPAGTPARSGADPHSSVSKNNSYWGEINFKGNTSDARISELNKIISDNAYFANMDHSGQRIRTARRNTKLAQGEIEVIKNSKNNQNDVLKKTSEILTEVGEKVSKVAGEKYRSVANEIASNLRNFQGKKIRSYNDAIKSLNKLLNNPNLKFNSADKKALSNAMAHINAKDMANKLGNISKGFKVADIVQKIDKVREKSIIGFETGNWTPLGLELESWIIAGLVSSIGLAIVTAVLASVGIAVVAPTVAAVIGIVAAAIAASFIDDKMVEKINNIIINKLY